MGGSTRAALLALTMLGSALAPRASGGAIVLRDAAHHELRLEQPPRRIITLLPSLTETVCALGECARLIATDRYSNWPASVQALPKAGGLDDAQIELMVGLQPDLVVLAHALRVTERLRMLGVATFDLETESYADIARTVTTLGELLGVPQRAVALNLEIERSVNFAAQSARVALHGRHPSVYYEIDGAPYGAGPKSFIGELLNRLGTRNILGAELGPFPKLNPEYVVTHEPDVIFLSPDSVSDLAGRPGWARMRAVREARLCAFPPAVRDTIVRPGPRVAEGLRAMAECLIRVAP
jgi:iron complex transport system substrate-binding protein